MDLDLKIATQIQNFFQYDLIYIPLAMEGKILRVEVQIPTIEPLNWLAQQKSDIKTYWSDRRGHFTMAGVGTLDAIAGDLPINYANIFGQLRQNLSSLFPKVRYYGGIGFSQDRPIDATWKLFGNYRFVVPRFEIWTDGTNTFFACNFRYKFSADLQSEELDSTQAKIRKRELDLILDELTKLDFTQIEIDSVLPPPLDFALPKLCERVDKPDRIDWQRNIDKALAAFTERQLDKIVLARQSILTFTSNLQPQSLLRSLKPNNFHSYHFCFQIDPTTAFIGTSPERLYYRQDRLLKTEAIAGTRQRGDSDRLDRELSYLLRNSPKDIHEHQLVVNNLQGILSELCHSVTVDRELTILKLNKVQHLYTQCQGTLKSDLTDADILPKLHPTPAVGGAPRTPALKLIQELEPFERGWYAAPVGWVGDDDAEFAVAIRSGLIDRDRLLLFAGAGIVRGSQSEEEWTEIENKIRHFTDLFTDVPPPQIANLSLTE
ncbi:isochorismate synthase [Chamaesiphon sp. VAR_48_metabat_135_sub]|uniref:isochorismate synthase n=1 Tax=Chamaesiphon sp. VAR_48_metabat_135_sub TaxID=2964699 RepID=UPI00286BC1F8|nr:isochorismate synthase [Chamaesiphon sp. VAR_48_metabat_135_sub]